MVPAAEDTIRWQDRACDGHPSQADACLRLGKQAAASLLILPSLAKQVPATATALRGYRDAPVSVVAPCPQRSRAIGAVKTEVVVAVVHGTEGTPRYA